MKRFTVTLTVNNNSGPFDILYNGSNGYILATLETGSVPASNIIASTLSNGVSILTGDDVSGINIINNKTNCNNIIHYTYIPPTPSPTSAPTTAPTTPPTTPPTTAPTTAPTAAPSITPSPTTSPTTAPTTAPTTSPTTAPTSSPVTPSPTTSPTTSPTMAPVTPSPTSAPTTAPTSSPTTPPTTAPTTSPTTAPTSSPTTPPTTAPTTSPTTAPTSAPVTSAPTTSPTTPPTTSPTTAPTIAPTPAPVPSPSLTITSGCSGGVNTGFITVNATGGSGNYTYNISTTPPGSFNGLSSASSLSDATYYVGAYDNVYGTSTVTTRVIACTAAPTAPPTTPPTTSPTSAPVDPYYYYTADRATCGICTVEATVTIRSSSPLSIGSWYSEGTKSYSPIGSTSGPSYSYDVDGIIYTQSSTCIDACLAY